MQPESPDKDAHHGYASNTLACTICHLPYAGNLVPLRNTTSKCGICK